MCVAYSQMRWNCVGEDNKMVRRWGETWWGRDPQLHVTAWQLVWRLGSYVWCLWAERHWMHWNLGKTARESSKRTIESKMLWESSVGTFLQVTRQFIRIRVRSRGTSPGFFFFFFLLWAFRTGQRGSWIWRLTRKGKGNKEKSKRTRTACWSSVSLTSQKSNFLFPFQNWAKLSLVKL